MREWVSSYMFGPVVGRPRVFLEDQQVFKVQAPSSALSWFLLIQLSESKQSLFTAAIPAPPCPVPIVPSTTCKCSHRGRPTPWTESSSQKPICPGVSTGSSSDSYNFADKSGCLQLWSGNHLSFLTCVLVISPTVHFLPPPSSKFFLEYTHS